MFGIYTRKSWKNEAKDAMANQWQNVNRLIMFSVSNQSHLSAKITARMLVEYRGISADDFQMMASGIYTKHVKPSSMSRLAGRRLEPFPSCCTYKTGGDSLSRNSGLSTSTMMPAGKLKLSQFLLHSFLKASMPFFFQKSWTLRSKSILTYRSKII